MMHGFHPPHGTFPLENLDLGRVAVIGDVMLDSYIEGDVKRISPEAPIPVMHALSERSVPGGAANVVANLGSLGVQASIVGVTGRDEAREKLVALLAGYPSIDHSGLVTAEDRCTTRKLRVIGARQQIVRIDHEDRTPCDPLVEQRTIEAAIAAVDGADVVVISDYGKGVCSDRLIRAVTHHARSTGKYVLVDPKRRDVTAYAGASLLTPNTKELAEATGLPCETDEQVIAAAAVVGRMCEADVLVTRSEKGMSFCPRDGEALHLPTVAQDVFDVSGAGDTVVAVLAGAIAGGFPMASAIKLANLAAGIVVAKVGTACVSREQLAEAVSTQDMPADEADGRCLTLEEAVALRHGWAARRLTVGVANGCFDLIHPGHVSLIRKAAESCDRLIMALNSDASVRRLKGPTRPVQSEQARAEVMGAIKGVAAVVLFSEDTPLELIQALQPDVLVKGADYTEDNVVGADIVRARGGRVILATLTPGQSTTRLLAAANG